MRKKKRVLVEPGRLGVTNEQMRPALRRWQDDPEALRQLREEYPRQFEHAVLKYATVAERRKAEEATGPVTVNEAEERFLGTLGLGRQGLTQGAVRQALRDAAEEAPTATSVQRAVLLRHYRGAEVAHALSTLSRERRERLATLFRRCDEAVAAGYLRF